MRGCDPDQYKCDDELQTYVKVINWTIRMTEQIIRHDVLKQRSVGLKQWLVGSGSLTEQRIVHVDEQRIVHVDEQIPLIANFSAA